MPSGTSYATTKDHHVPRRHDTCAIHNTVYQVEWQHSLTTSAHSTWLRDRTLYRYNLLLNIRRNSRHSMTLLYGDVGLGGLKNGLTGDLPSALGLKRGSDS